MNFLPDHGAGAGPILLLIPGMAADERLFAPQLRAFPHAACPEWIPPKFMESITSYAERFAAVLLKQLGGRHCILVGASFGGFIASELVRHLPACALVLLGSVPTPRQLPPTMRFSGLFAPLFATLPVPYRALAQALTKYEDGMFSPISQSAIEQAAAADDRFVRWALSAVVRWTENLEPIPCPIAHVHGRCDRVLPIAFTHPTTVLHDAGHIVTLSHPAQVNAVISDAIRTCIERDSGEKI